MTSTEMFVKIIVDSYNYGVGGYYVLCHQDILRRKVPGTKTKEPKSTDTS